MGYFAEETTIEPAGDGAWRCRLSTAWSISGTPNGGYALAPLLRAMREAAGFPDPVSVTTHFLRPATGDTDADLSAEIVRIGRSTGVVRGELSQQGRLRLASSAVFADLSAPASDAAIALSPPPLDIPGPDECTPRAEIPQGVELPILDRVDVRVHPEQLRTTRTDRAELDGWVRFVDDTRPCSLSLVLFTDVFPPSPLTVAGPTGWVPTVELTVHVRRRPASGWIQARFVTDDLHEGRMIESGWLWDQSGALVAQSRQLGLLMTST